MLTGNEWILYIVGQLVLAAAIWGGIRSDIKGLHERIASAQSAVNRAHDRIDDLLSMDATGNHRMRR